MQATTIVACTVAIVLLAGFGAAQDYDYEPRRPAPARPQPSSFSSGPKPTPVPILKQINRHNEDGSYTYGYEGADGSFKIETKLPTGEVKGKYGFVDDTGKLRIVEYGANRYGFQPAGEGITVAPPTLVDETTNKDGSINPDFVDNNQYYEPAPAPAPRLAPRPKPAPQPQFEFNSPPRFAPPPPAPRPHAAPLPARPAPVEIDYTSPPRFPQRPPPAPAPVHTFSPAPRPAPRPALQHNPFAEPAPVEEDIQYAEPARRPAPRPVPLRPAPQAPAFRPAPQPAPYRPPAPQPSGGRGGVLDQLARDYALPQDSAAPLHDISFGYY